MTDEPSPRPWSVHYGAEIWDANGNMVYNLNGFNRGKKDEANAALIVDAVNERDKLRAELADKIRNYEDVIAFHTRTEEGLRDIVRRVIPFVEGVVNAGALVNAEDPDIVPFLTQEQKAAARKAYDEAVPLLAEAREAIGEVKE